MAESQSLPKCLSFPSHTDGAGVREQRNLLFQRKLQFKKKKTHLQAYAKCATSACALLSVFSLCLLKVTCGVGPDLQQANTTKSQFTASEDPTCFILNLGRAGEAG